MWVPWAAGGNCLPESACPFTYAQDAAGLNMVRVQSVAPVFCSLATAYANSPGLACFAVVVVPAPLYKAFGVLDLLLPYPFL